MKVPELHGGGFPVHTPLEELCIVGIVDVERMMIPKCDDLVCYSTLGTEIQKDFIFVLRLSHSFFPKPSQSRPVHFASICSNDVLYMRAGVSPVRLLLFTFVFCHGDTGDRGIGEWLGNFSHVSYASL